MRPLRFGLGLKKNAAISDLTVPVINGVPVPPRANHCQHRAQT